MGELKKARVPESDDVLIMLDYCSKLTVVGYQKKKDLIQQWQAQCG